MYYFRQYMASSGSAPVPGPGLKRVLGLPALVLYGIILIQPTAPMSPFGVVSVKAEREGAPGAPVGLVLGPGIGNPSPEELASRYSKPGETVTLSASASVDRKAKDSLKEPLPKGAGLVAAGIDDNYFLTAFLPPPTAAVTLRPVALAAPAPPEGKPAPEGKPVAAEAESEVVLSAPNALATLHGKGLLTRGHKILPYCPRCGTTIP